MTSVGEKPTIYVTTKTIVIPVTTAAEKPKTVESGKATMRYCFGSSNDFPDDRDSIHEHCLQHQGDIILDFFEKTSNQGLDGH
jgi:hypothetical protein